MKSGWLVVVVALLAASQALPVAAQAPAASFDQLSRWVRIGDTVYVRDTSGREVRGEVADLSGSLLKLASGAATREYLETQVLSVSRRAPDSLSNGAWIGLLAGVGFGVLGAAMSCGDGYCHDSGATIAIVIGIYGGIGAGIGVGIDALVPAEKVVIFRRDAGRGRVSVSPSLLPGRQGLALSVSF